MGDFKKLSKIISIDDSGEETIICVNGQWQFTLPDGLSYGTDEKFTLIEGGIDLSGSTKPLVITEDYSVYEQAFRVAVEEHYSFTGDHATIIDCKYDNRFTQDNGSNTRNIIIDEDDFYVDLISINTWPFGIQAEIRVRGENVTPYNITMMVNPEGDDHWQHIAAYFKEIAASICRVKKPTKKKATTKKTLPIVSDPNCVMSGSVLKRYIGNQEDVVLPEGITKLEDNIFSGRDELRSIVIPEGVKTIGSRAFENCYNLEHVVLPKSIQEIGAYAFVDCHKLESINLDGKLKYIAGSAFSECFKLQNVTIPATVTDIDAFAFKNCRSFTQIALLEGLKSIGFTAFAYCENLEYLYIPASVTGIYDNFMDQTPFDGCESLIIHCPEGSYAEEYAKSHGIRYTIAATPTQKVKTPKKKTSSKKADNLAVLPSVEVVEPTIAVDSESMKKDHARVANDDGICNQKTSDTITEEPLDSFVIVDGVLKKYKGDNKYVKVPAGVRVIGEKAFAFEEKITSVVIPEGVETIGAKAFYCCEILREIILPNGLKEIGESAFEGCSNLKNITLFPSEGTNDRDIAVFPDSVECIQDEAFRSCVSLSELLLPRNLHDLGRSVFDDCNKLKCITIPSNIENFYLYEDAFSRYQIDQLAPEEGCCELTANIVRLLGIARPGHDDIVVTTVGDWLFEGAPADCAPKTFRNVTAIAEEAFAYTASLRRIVIPDNITKIGNSAFLESDVQYIEMADSIEEIGTAAFSYCVKLRGVVLSKKIRTISEEMFEHCELLEELVIPDGVTTIAKNAFSGCYSLRKLSIPASVTEIEDSIFPDCCTFYVTAGSYAEEYCKQHGFAITHEEAGEPPFIPVVSSNQINSCATLSEETECAIDEMHIVNGVLNKYIGSDTDVTIPHGVKIIGGNAFMSTKIASVVIPESVQQIASGAFFMCKNLTEIVIPEGTTELGRTCFSFCLNLEKVYLPQSLCHIGDLAFNMCNKAVLHVYSGSYAEQYAKENNMNVIVKLTPEQESEQKRQQEAIRQQREYEEQCRREAEEQKRRTQEEEQREYEERCRREAAEREQKAAEEAERRRQAAEKADLQRQAELAARRSRFDEISSAITAQMQIVAQNKGWFGAQAKARKAAKEQVDILQQQLEREFPNGRP